MLRTVRRGARPFLEGLEERWVPATLIEFVDFGDLPAPYPVTLAEDGARHFAVGPYLGQIRGGEADGQHSPNADADVFDDGGFSFPFDLTQGQ